MSSGQAKRGRRKGERREISAVTWPGTAVTAPLKPASTIALPAPSGQSSARPKGKQKTGVPASVSAWIRSQDREISHSSSASRDTAALRMLILPRPVLSGGGGRVVFAGRYPLRRNVRWWRYGNVVVLHHGDRFVTIYPDHVPPNSILREFIGGSGFEY